MKSKGLLGGKYSVGLDEEVVNDILDKMDNDETFEQSENKKRKIEEKDEKNEKDEIIDRKIKEKDESINRKLEEKDESINKVEPKRSTTVNVGGVISSPGVGYIRVESDDTLEDEDNADTPPTAEDNKKEKKKSKMTAAEYLVRQVKSKVENRSTKANLNSMKTKFLTGKKKISSIQPECGVEQDFMLIMKNNLQRANISNPSPTAGKYMLYT